MTSTASLLLAGGILKQRSLGRVRTPLGKRQEILAAFDGSGMSAARFAAMVGINYSTFCSWVQKRNQKQGKDSLLTEAVAKPQVQWIEAEMAFGSKPRCAGGGMEIELLGGGVRLRIRDERDAELAALARAGKMPPHHPARPRPSAVGIAKARPHAYRQARETTRSEKKLREICGGKFGFVTDLSQAT